MADFGYPPGPAPVTDARLVTAPPPEVLVLSDSIEGNVRNADFPTGFSTAFEAAMVGAAGGEGFARLGTGRSVSRQAFRPPAGAP